MPELPLFDETMSDDDPLTDLALRYIDDQLDAEAFAQLNALLAADDAACERFIALCIHARALAEPLNEALSEDEPEAVVGRVGSTTWRRGAWAAAAIALVAALTAIMFHARTNDRPIAGAPRAVALLSDQSADARFDDAMPSLGGDVLPGEIRLSRGTAQLMFRGGAVVDLRGPCDFAALAPGRGRLTHGSLEAYVPEPARGFVIEAANAVVTDLGTRFSLDADEDQIRRVDVLEGSVRLDAGSDHRMLTAGLRADVNGTAIGRIASLAEVDRPAWRRYLQLNVLKDEAGFAAFAFDGGVDPLVGPEAKIVGNVAAAPDRFGHQRGAIALDGATAIALDTSWPAGDFTAAVWVRPEAIGRMMYIVGTQISADPHARFLRLSDDGRPQFTMIPDPAKIHEAVARPLSVGQWVHLAVTFAAQTPTFGQLTLFVNGRPAQSIFITGDTTRTDRIANMKIGARPDQPDQYRFRGDLDDLILIKRAMSEEQVLDLYNASRPRPTSEQGDTP